MEKPDLDFLSLSPFLSPRKQLAQSFSAANSCSSLPSLLLFQRLTPVQGLRPPLPKRIREGPVVPMAVTQPLLLGFQFAWEKTPSAF